MDLNTEASKIQFALKILRAQWDSAREKWSDSVRREFEEKHLQPLMDRVSFTLGEIGRLNHTLQKIEQECA